MVTGGSSGPSARVFETGKELAGLDDGGNGLVIVAHPDDETLWAGGQLLLRRDWSWSVIALCRESDPDRRPRFFRALEQLGAQGRIANLDDEPDQRPLSDSHVRAAVVAELDDFRYDVVLTHSPDGEYTRHRRHEEVSRAVLGLWRDGKIDAPALWLFAYHDRGGTRLPGPIEHADLTFRLSDSIWLRKRAIIEGVYGFGPGTWEYDATPAAEAFWRVESPGDLERLKELTHVI